MLHVVNTKNVFSIAHRNAEMFRDFFVDMLKNDPDVIMRVKSLDTFKLVAHTPEDYPCVVSNNAVGTVIDSLYKTMKRSKAEQYDDITLDEVYNIISDNDIDIGTYQQYCKLIEHYENMESSIHQMIAAAIVNKPSMHYRCNHPAMCYIIIKISDGTKQTYWRAYDPGDVQPKYLMSYMSEWLSGCNHQVMTHPELYSKELIAEIENGIQPLDLSGSPFIIETPQIDITINRKYLDDYLDTVIPGITLERHSNFIAIIRQLTNKLRSNPIWKD